MNEKELKKLQRQKKKKQPKINIYSAIDNYLFFNRELPDGINYHQVITYLFERFYTLPLISNHLNKFLNRKEENIKSFHPRQILDFYKKIIQDNKIEPYMLFKYFPERSESNIISKIAEIKNWSIKEAKAWYYNRLKKNPTELEAILNSGQVNLSNEEKDLINVAIKEMAKEEQKELENSSSNLATEKEQNKNNSNYLPEISQEIIEEQSLSLFDIKLLKKSNKILYIFIDKNHQKKYFIEPLKIEFYIHKRSGVLNNDFIEEKNDSFIKYFCTDYRLFNKLKYMIDMNYKNNFYLEEV